MTPTAQAHPSAGQSPDNNGSVFVETPTAQQVFLACRLARESHSPVFLEGPSHIGKTWALRRWQSDPDNGPAILVEILGPGQNLLVRTTARACGISDKASDTDALIKRIRSRLTSDTVIIFDELHLLEQASSAKRFFAAVEFIRRLYDSIQCGIVCSLTRIQGFRQEAAGELVQIWRRGVHKFTLPVMPTKIDLGMILKHNGFEGQPLAAKRGAILKDTVLPDPEMTVRLGDANARPYDILRDQARMNGLKAVTERIRYARILAEKAAARVSWHHFADAHLRIEKESEQQGEWK